MFKLKLSTPERSIVHGKELEEITLPGFASELNILPGHAPMMTTMNAGIVSYKLKNEDAKKIAISWGYCQVSPEGVNVLAEAAIEAEDVDLAVVQKHLKEQQERLGNEELDQAEWTKTQHEIERLQAGINLVSLNKH